MKNGLELQAETKSEIFHVLHAQKLESDIALHTVGLGLRSRQ